MMTPNASKVGVEQLRHHLDGEQPLRPWMLLWVATNASLLVLVALVWPLADDQRSAIARAERDAAAQTAEAFRIRNQIGHLRAHAARVAARAEGLSSESREARIRELKLALALSQERLASLRRMGSATASTRVALERSVDAADDLRAELTTGGWVQAGKLELARSRMERMRERVFSLDYSWSVRVQLLQVRIAQARKKFDISAPAARSYDKPALAGSFDSKKRLEMMNWPQLRAGAVHVVWRPDLSQPRGMIRIEAVPRLTVFGGVQVEIVAAVRYTVLCGYVLPGDAVNHRPFDSGAPVWTHRAKSPMATTSGWGRDTYAWEGR